MMQKTTEAQRQMWISHIEAAKIYPGKVEAYCRARQISRPAFYYWKKKLTKEPTSKALPSFIPVEVARFDERAPPVLPDPRWLAELIHHLQTGGAR